MTPLEEYLLELDSAGIDSGYIREALLDVIECAQLDDKVMAKLSRRFAEELKEVRERKS